MKDRIIKWQDRKSGTRAVCDCSAETKKPFVVEEGQVECLYCGGVIFGSLGTARVDNGNPTERE